MDPITAGFFLKRWGKWAALAGGVVLAVVAFNSWKSNLIETADAAGFERARATYQAAVMEANQREAATQIALHEISAAFGNLSTKREQDVRVTLSPIIERINSEVSSDARYRDCVASDSVLDGINAGRTAVNASIAASAPAAD